MNEDLKVIQYYTICTMHVKYTFFNKFDNNLKPTMKLGFQ
jgi:hypothetical protein